MYKTDKRLTSNHLTEEENKMRLKGIKKLPDVSDKAEEIDIDFEKAGLLERVNARKAMSQKEDESKVE
jgi:hypothetical protein